MKKIILLSFVTLLLISCKKDIYNTKPTANYTVNTDTGTIVTRFLFDASDCTDKEDATTELQVRWDFDSDSIWDTEWDTAKTEVFRFDAEGSYTATLEVTDTEGLTSQQTTSLTINNRGINYQSFVDVRDGQIYYNVQIGNQYWMAENLNYETCWLMNSECYDNNSSNCDVYGRLYEWEAALTACPIGWHLPTDDEWKQLEMFLGMSQSQANLTGWRGTDEGEKMKSTSGWNNKGNGTNSSGFNALPGGFFSSSVAFGSLGSYGYWWSSTESSGARAWTRYLYCDFDQVVRSTDYKALGFSVRCVKD